MSELSETEQRVLAAVDLAAAVDLLRDLIRVPSVTGSAAEGELLHLLAGMLERRGLAVDHWQLDLAALQAEPGFPGTEAPREEGWGLVAELTGRPGAGEPELVLQGHVDVVPPGDLSRWDGDPFLPRLVDGAVHGRGACDMKAGVVANLAVVDAILAAGVRLDRGLGLHLVAGEEDGGLGAFATLSRGHRGRACVITEPTGGTLVTATGGALTFRLTVTGAATHGSTRYAGVSAVDAYWTVHRALQDFEAERNRDVDPLMAEYPIAYPLSVGKVQAGDWASSVPDLLVAEGRLGVALGEDPADARAAFEARVAQVCSADPWLAENPVTVQWSGGQFASGRLATGHPLQETVAAAHGALTGRPPRTRGAPYGSDLRLYAAAGVPTLHYGPGDVRLAHGAQESVRTDELDLVIRTLALTVLRTCGVQD